MNFKSLIFNFKCLKPIEKEKYSIVSFLCTFNWVHQLLKLFNICLFSFTPIQLLQLPPPHNFFSIFFSDVEASEKSHYFLHTLLYWALLFFNLESSPAFNCFSVCSIDILKVQCFCKLSDSFLMIRFRLNISARQMHRSYWTFSWQCQEALSASLYRRWC